MYESVSLCTASRGAERVNAALHQRAVSRWYSASGLSGQVQTVQSPSSWQWISMPMVQPPPLPPHPPLSRSSTIHSASRFIQLVASSLSLNRCRFITADSSLSLQHCRFIAVRAITLPSCAHHNPSFMRATHPPACAPYLFLHAHHTSSFVLCHTSFFVRAIFLPSARFLVE